MRITILTGLIHGDLAFDIEKIKSYDKPKLKKDSYENEDVIFTIEVNDNSYMYFGKSERDKDYAQLKKILKKPFLYVKKKAFIDFMTDENGTGMVSIIKKLHKNGKFTVEDLLEDCGYMPSSVIKNKNSVPKQLRDNEYNNDFEINPENFVIILV